MLISAEFPHTFGQALFDLHRQQRPAKQPFDLQATHLEIGLTVAASDGSYGLEMTSMQPDKSDGFATAVEAGASAKGWPSREGVMLDPATGQVGDATRWELELEESEERLSQVTDIRYIKLGPAGAWFEHCIRDGLIEVGHSAVPHDLAEAGDWDAVRAAFASHNPAKASDFTRELRDFYTLPRTTLWITIGDGRLWWAFAEPELNGVTEAGRGSRARRVLGRWSDRDIERRRLTLDGLSTRLTKVAAYRQTLCRVDHADYLLRRLRGVEEPAVQTALAAQAQLVRAASALIEGLDWRDFELMTDLIFAQSGWRRVSAVGGSGQADSDLILEQAATGERAMVQVKSSADQSVVADYVNRFKGGGWSKGFLVCHSPKSSVRDPKVPAFHLWLGDVLADKAMGAGLMPWLIEKSR